MGKKPFNNFIFHLLFIYALRHFGCLAIIGGKEVIFAPYFVQISLTPGFHVSRMEPRKKCGGTILAPDVVITSARCLTYTDGYMGGRFALAEEVSVVRDYLDGQFEEYRCEGYRCHPDFDTNDVTDSHIPYDIALLRLTQSVASSYQGHGILPVCPDSHSYKQGWAIGCGWTNIIPELNNHPVRPKQVLLHKDVAAGWHFVPNDEHNKELRRTRLIQMYFGSGSRWMTSGIFEGDEGGPLVAMSSRDGTREDPQCLVGVASFHIISSNGQNLISVFTPASTYTQFIENFILPD